MCASWWLDKYDVNKSSYKAYKSSSGGSWWRSSYKSATKGWMDKLGGFGWFDLEYSNREDKKRRLYKRVLNQIQTSINVISGDKELKVRWSDGESQNSPDSNIVHVSPDNLIDDSEVIVEDTLDVLTGKVYLSSILNKQIVKEDYALANLYRSKENRDSSYAPTIKLWEALETNIAKKFIEDNWCGFMPHIIKHGESICSKKEAVQSFIDSTLSTPNLQAVISGIAWNLVNSDDMIVIPDIYEKCVDAAVEILENPESENKKLSSCREIVKKVKEILQEQHQENEKQQTDNDNDNHNNDNDKLNKSNLSKSFKSLKITDSELFGLKVKNSTDESLAQIKNDKDETGKDSVTEINSVDLSAKFSKFVIPEYDYAYDESYKNIVIDLNNCINAVKNNFYFINNKMFLNSFGHISGDVDENNLHKIFLNDDRLMQRKDIVSQKKIAVCLLIDESGSMEDKYIDARNTAIILAEGLKNYFDISIYGHTAEQQTNYEFINGCLITEYYTPRNRHIQTCVEISSKSENVDGLAIELVAKKFVEDYPYSRRIIFVISDGEPASTYYGGGEAEEHVNNVCEMVRKRMDTEVYGIGVCDAYSDETGESLYREGNYVILEDVMSSVGIITRFLKQICNKNKRVLS